MTGDEYFPKASYDKIRETVNAEMHVDLSFTPSPEIRALCNYITGLEERIERIEARLK